MSQVHFHPPTGELNKNIIDGKMKELFTVQERLTISDLISRDKIDYVGAALEVENPERAFWLDLYLKLKRPRNTPVDSKVEEELRKWEAENGTIDTPEKAEAWEKRLNLEREGKELPPLEETLKEATPVVSEPVIEEEAVVAPVEEEAAPVVEEEVATPVEETPVVVEEEAVPVTEPVIEEAPVIATEEVFGTKRRRTTKK